MNKSVFQMLKAASDARALLLLAKAKLERALSKKASNAPAPVSAVVQSESTTTDTPANSPELHNAVQSAESCESKS